MRIGIVGHFGGHENFTDGQSVKVKSLYEGLMYNCPSLIVDKVDTYYLVNNPVKLAVSFLKCLLIDRKIVFLPAARGRKVFFRLFYHIKKITKKDIFHDCIAGSLDQEIIKYPKWKKYLNSFNVNWMESPEQVEKLREIGLRNAEYLPNFKHIFPISEEELDKISFSAPFKFCTFCRVTPEKGIEDAIKAIKEMNTRENGLAFLDVYGPIEPGYESWFAQLRADYCDCLNYRGIIDPHDSVGVLKTYFAMLFPTQFYTEGMPGSIIDAMFAGLPVIARRWAWCDNMIRSGYNGISYDFNQPEELKRILWEIVHYPDGIISMRPNCLKEADKYSEQRIAGIIIKTMGLSSAGNE